MNASKIHAKTGRKALRARVSTGSAALALCAFAVAPAVHAAPVASRPLTAQSMDLGAANAATTMSVTVGLSGRNEAALAAAVAALYEQDSPTYHRWLSDADLAAYGPGADELAAARSSLAAQGLHVDSVSADGRLLKVTGSVASVQKAFGTSIHRWQAGGRSFLRSAATPKYQGEHAELFSGVSGLTGLAMQPQVARQIDFATGRPSARVAVGAAATADPLSRYTNECFGPQSAVHIQGAHIGHGRPTGVQADWKGPSYLDFNNVDTRKGCGYTAQQLVHHYGFDEAQALGWTGKGQTIVIVDAYGSATALSDLNAFSRAMNLPTMDTHSFQTVYPGGFPVASDAGWALETTLDIEWAHAFAPDAKIVLVAAADANDLELGIALQYAVAHRLGNVISNSFGLAESLSSPIAARMYDQIFERAAASGIAVNVATGDAADNGLGTPVGAASVPADSPYATAIGGTSINVPSANGPVEAAWGTAVTGLGSDLNPYLAPITYATVEGTGGGESVFFAKPAYESKLPGKGRQLPDVSAVADPQTGAIIVFTDPDSGVQYFDVVGGTSLATPVFSAMWAVADQAAGESLGQAAPIISRMPAFAVRDVLPIKPGPSLASGTMTIGAGPAVSYDAAQLLGIDATQPTGFASFLFSGRSSQDGVPAWEVLGFGIDASLAAAPGWDNATGYGVPNGILFLDAARVFARTR